MAILQTFTSVIAAMTAVSTVMPPSTGFVTSVVPRSIAPKAPAITKAPAAIKAAAATSTSICSYQKARVGQGKCMCSGKAFPVNPETTSTMDGKYTVFGVDYCHYTSMPTATTFSPAPLPTQDTSPCFDKAHMEDMFKYPLTPELSHRCALCLQKGMRSFDPDGCHLIDPTSDCQDVYDNDKWCDPKTAYWHYGVQGFQGTTSSAH